MSWTITKLMGNHRSVSYVNQRCQMVRQGPGSLGCFNIMYQYLEGTLI